ncbi:MAG: FKBP-type peptidyl-prolyl cis-trans isomerase [Chitinispirillia bacterium]
MKFLKIIIPLLSFYLFSFNCESGSEKSKTVTLNTNRDTVSYFIGTDIAKSLENIRDEIDMDVLIQGLNDKLSDKKLLVNENQAQKVMREFSSKMQKKQRDEKEAEGKENKESGEKFLEENKGKEGVVTTESGLQYSVIKQGNGKKPEKTDRVRVHYKGTTIDGKEFDSSYKRGEPATFPITGVIKGWTEALLLMNVGSKYKLCIPSDLAYGERGAGQDIGPNSTLIFEVELLDIVK